MLLRIRKNAHVIAVVVGLILIKQIMTYWLPGWAIGAPYDDRLMVIMSETLLAGDWIGPYGVNTLVKGVGFPLYLLLTHVLGINYIHFTELCYSISCLVFVWATRELLPKRWMRLALFCVLLFAPVMASQANVQRVYRCAITPMFVLLAFGSLIRLICQAKRGEKYLKMLPWALIAGLSIAIMWHSREDGFWLLPATVLFALLAIVFCVRTRASGWYLGVISACIPLALLALSIWGISSINNHWYGQNLTTELAGGNFPQAIKAIYSVDNEEGEEDPGPAAAVTAKILQRIIAVSPSLKSIENHVWDAWKDWHGPVQPWNELGNNVFFWMVRDAAMRAGYYETPQKSEEFYAKVASEIKAAIADGKLKERPTMPSALMPPFKSADNLVPYLGAVLNNVALVVTSADTEAGYEQTDTTNVDAMDSAVYANVEIIPEGEEPRLRMRVSVEACNVVQKLYLVLSPVLGILGVVGFVLLLRDRVIRRLRGHGMLLLAMTGILIGFWTLIGGLAYNHLFSTATTSMYASGTYPLYLSFGVMGTCYLALLIANRKKGTLDAEDE